MTTTTTNPFFPSLSMRVWSEPGRAQYIGRPRVWATITGDNQFTPETYFAADMAGSRGLSVIGVFTFPAAEGKANI